MGLFADLIDRVVSSATSTKAILFAIRDASAGAATDQKYIPLQVDASGYLRISVAGSSAGSGIATEAKQDDQLERMPTLLDDPPLADTFAVPTRQVGSVDVIVVGAPAQQAAVDSGFGFGLPVRTVIDDRLPAALEQDRLASSLGFGSLGEGANAHLGTVGFPLAVRGADEAGSTQQLALDRTREDDYHAARLTDGTLFIVPAKTEQLPAALESDRLATSIGLAGGPLAIYNPAPVILSDGLSQQGDSLNPLRTDPTGTTTQPTLAAQGTPAALSGRWPVQVTDGTNTMPTGDAAARASYHRLTDGTNTIGTQAAPVIADPSTPTRTSTGTPTPAASGVILAAAGRVWAVAATFSGVGANLYFQIHEAGTLATTTMIPGLSFPLDITTPYRLISFDRPLAITDGCKWAMSSTRDTYTASIQTAIVFYQVQEESL